VIAFVLAFLFRTFEAEAFVIPTGSMAPTLQGRHKDLPCGNCGYRVRASASDEDAAIERIARGQAQFDERRDKQVVAVTCPMCRFETSVDPDLHGDEFPGYNGDRIIVAKFPFDFIDPRRWDIVVFKFPNDAKINYIKRLVGLPNETVKIRHGNLYSKPEGGTQFEMERKPPEKQLAMAQMVYDNNYVVPAMTGLGWPLRWQPTLAESGGRPATWTASDDGKSYKVEGDKSIAPVWIRYQHSPPTELQWLALEDGKTFDPAEIKPQLITDFYAYNAGILREPNRDRSNGLHWVGDLMLQAQVNVEGEQGKLLLDLVEGGVHFGATIDVATGEAVLSIDGQEAFHPKAATAIQGKGSHHVTFANFDDQLMLWVDGSVVSFDSATTYGPLDNDAPQSTAEDLGDLAPVGVGAEGGLAVTVSDLVVKRDIYYIADKYGERQNTNTISDYRDGVPVLQMNREEQLAEFFSNPIAWRTPGTNGLTPFEARKEAEFQLAADQFFVLGDNSPASADGRLWPGQHFVEREMMIGKALFIYWPHGLYHIPGTGIPFPYGMFPNFKDMGFVR
jgi:signal peptidase I